MVSQYYGLVEAIKLGLREQISIAKQTLWKMPLFIGRLKDFAAAQAYHPETYPFFRRSEKPTAD